ncbi:multiple epidermal growth factor-like domains protein 9 [Chanos chanos]|uniref:Multiple epidermal growth factor-like domains protein 9 n=1 Tax=Chanos chanos TaxID=29144 RepID=A0A6J2WGG4_CHACN|nr:multiple epidermal growth factor-like domains protein 9 [Chanos chanos]
MVPTVKQTETTKQTTETGFNTTVKPVYTSTPSQNDVEKPYTSSSYNTTSWTSVPPVLSTDKRCNCSVEGTVNPDECDADSGQCVCVSGYTGLLCDVCDEGYFTNGTMGCQPCACDSFGAVGPRCDSSGVCVCKAGVYGDKCDDCHPGFFHFSNTGCQPCQCNNHTHYCHPQSGVCVNCQNNTRGPSCEECKYNFYRTPGRPLTDACTPCPCSTVTSTGSCSLDASGLPICDQCNPEYKGPNCEQCRDGFYNADSICLPCNCSGNADPRTSPRLCHPETGHCLRCINNTTGLHCERCTDGFTGDALKRSCKPIVRVLPSPLSTTMSSSINASTTLHPLNTPTATSTTQSLLTSLGGPSNNNSTTATITEVSWTQFNVIILAVIIVVVVALMGVAGGVYSYREYQNRKINAPFWTIELKEDNISFSSYHDSIPNADVSGLLEDEPSEVAANGQLALTSSANMYKA